MIRGDHVRAPAAEAYEIKRARCVVAGGTAGMGAAVAIAARRAGAARFAAGGGPIALGARHRT